MGKSYSDDLRKRVVAPMLMDTPITGKIFRQWLVECLILEMVPGSIVVTDNLSAQAFASLESNTKLQIGVVDVHR